MSKFNVRICTCGRIHFVPEAEINAALEADKNFVLVCGGCGRVTAIGADIEQDWCEPENTIYNMYAYPMGQYDDFTLTADNFESAENRKGIHKVWYSNGKRVMMETHYYANNYTPYTGKFEDMTYPDFLFNANRGFEYLKAEIEKWEHDKVTVDMKALLRELSDEEAEALSHFLIEGLDWSGTKYERKK